MPATLTGAKVGLIRPPVVMYPKSMSFLGPVPPLGLAYIAAVLRDGGHDIQVIDSPGEAMEQHHDFESAVGTLRRIGLSPEEIVADLDADTQIIGITNMFLHEWPMIRTIAGLAKKRFPDATVIVGGETATSFWPWMFEQSEDVDYCVLGEGEGTALELIDRLHKGQSLVGMQGIATRLPIEDGIQDTGLSIRNRKLSEVPEPAWDLFPVEEYLAYGDFWGVHRGRSMPMLATRGCPYKCTFCSSPQMWTTKYVVRPPDDVADEIVHLAERYGVQNINFSDLTAITRRKWTLEFCDALEARNLDITWQLPTGTRAEALDAEVLQRLYDTGCRNLKYAPESGSERMLEIYDKKLKLPIILESARAAEKVGIVTGLNMILGHPEERWSDVAKTAVFLAKAAWAGCNDGGVMIYGAYPGSADWRKLVDSGEVVVDEEYHYIGLTRGSSQSVSYNPRMSARQLQATQWFMSALFYAVSTIRRPWRMWHHIRSLFGGEETNGFDQLIRIKRRGFARLDDEAMHDHAKAA